MIDYHVYIAVGGSMVKVGHTSKQPEERVAAINLLTKSLQEPCELTLYHYVTSSKEHCKYIEQQLISLLYKLGGKVSEEKFTGSTECALFEVDVSLIAGLLKVQADRLVAEDFDTTTPQELEYSEDVLKVPMHLLSCKYVTNSMIGKATELSLADKLVFVFLKSNPKVSQETAGEFLGVSRRTVLRSVATLQAIGLISVVRRRQLDGSVCNHYTVADETSSLFTLHK